MDESTPWRSWVGDGICRECAILDHNCFVFWFENSDEFEQSGTYLVYYHESDKEPRAVPFGGEYRRHLAAQPEARDLLMVGSGGNVFFHTRTGGQSEKMFTFEQLRLVTSVRFIGSHYYAAGYPWKLLRREGVEQWVETSFPHTETVGDDHIEDIDGFDENDIYVVSGSHLFHYDGQSWRRCQLPLAEFQRLRCVFCSPLDDMVYIGTSEYGVLRGREDKWKALHYLPNRSSVTHICEFDGRHLAVAESGFDLIEIRDDRLVSIRTPFGSHYEALASGHGQLITAGFGNAAVFDGQVWTSLFEPQLPSWTEDPDTFRDIRTLETESDIYDLLRDDRFDGLESRTQ
jgi:hypothetical protein